MTNFTLLTEAILRYAGQQKPEYALLLNGAWGSGKTHYWKTSIVPELIKKDLKPLYVSLYGLESIRDIDYQLIYSLHPLMQKRLAKAGGVLMRIGLEKFGMGMVARELLPELKKVVLCFDDLERTAGLQPSAVLGYINSFVEHEHIPTLVIANEVELLKKDVVEGEKYQRAKEKLIGRTFSYLPDIATVFDSVVLERYGAMKNREVMSVIRMSLLSIFESGKNTNLRTMKNALEACVSLVDESPKIGHLDANKLEAVFRLIGSIAAEVKSDEAKVGVLEDLFSGREGLTWAFYAKERKSQSIADDSIHVLRTFVDEYFDGDLSAVPQLPSLYAWITKGLLNHEALNAEILILQSETQQEIRDPKILFLGDFWRLSEVEVKNVAAYFLEEVRDEHIFSPVQLLKLCDVLTYCYEHGIIKETPKAIMQTFLQSVEGVDNSNQLNYEELAAHDFYFLAGNTSLPLDELKERFREIEKRYSKEKEQRNYMSLLDLLVEEPKSFFSAIADITGEMDYVTQPVFLHLDPAEVIAAIFRIEPWAIMAMSRAFYRRYIQVQNSNDYLSSEYENLKKIFDGLKERLDTLDGSLKHAAIQQLVKQLELILVKMKPVTTPQLQN